MYAYHCWWCCSTMLSWPVLPKCLFSCLRGERLTSSIRLEFPKPCFVLVSPATRQSLLLSSMFPAGIFCNQYAIPDMPKHMCCCIVAHQHVSFINSLVNASGWLKAVTVPSFAAAWSGFSPLEGTDALTVLLCYSQILWEHYQTCVSFG